MKIASFTLAGLALAAAYGLLFQGASDAGRWAVCQTAIAALALIYGVAAMRKDAPPMPPMDRWLQWALLALLAWGALQLVPLPLSVLRIVSPERAALHESLREVAGIETGDWAPISVAPWATLQLLERWMSAVLVLLLARGACARLRPGSWGAVIPLLALTTLEAAIGLAQKLVDVPVQGTYGNRNHYAALIDIGLPFALAGAFYLAGRRINGRAMSTLEALASVAVIPCVAVLALGGIWSLSRMGFLAMTAAAAVVLWQALRRQTGRPVLSAALLGCALLTGMAAMAPPELVERLAETNSESAGDNRLALWRETGDLVLSSLGTGSGLGAYEPAFLRFKRVAPDRTADFAHNDYLQILAEAGIIGLALAVIIAVRLVVPLVRKAHQGRDSNQWLRTGCLAALAGMGLHSASDYPLYVPGNLVLVAWVLGIAAFLGANVKQPRVRADV